jgi:peptide/nickel transport system permease protein
MIRRVVERLAASIGVVFGATTLIFLILNWLPGDTAALIAGEGASQETLDHVRLQLGLDRPLGQQYFDYLRGLLHGDLGRSYATRAPVLHELAAQFPSTGALALSAAAVAVLVGVPLGVAAAANRGRLLDQGIQVAGLTMISLPSFWSGLLAILVFSVHLRWLPILGGQGVAAAVLPVGCLGVHMSVPVQRMVRSGIAEALQEPFVTTLRAKGLRASRIFYVHVLRNVAISTVTLLGVLVGELFSGIVVIETLFARPGLGRLAVYAVNNKDIPLVQGAILATSVTYVAVNLLVDLSYAWIDPRVRLASKEAA